MSNVVIHPTALVSIPLRPLQGMVTSTHNPAVKELKCDGDVFIGPYCIIGEGVHLGSNVIIDSNSNIERGVRVGDNTLLVHRATIGGYSTVGSNCVVGGFIGENTKIGDNCRIFGTIAHKQEDPSLSWDHREFDEPSVTVHDWTFVSFHAFVAGGISLGPRAYVAAGAIVTKDVPPEHIAYGENSLCHYSEWPGQLSKSPFFRGDGMS